MDSFPYISCRHTDQIVSLQTAKKWLRMDVEGMDDDDMIIQDAIVSAVRRVEDECHLSLGVSEYTWETTGLPCDFADVKYVREIVSVTIDDQEVDSMYYRLIRVGESHCKIEWEKSVRPGRKVVIVFKAGFGVEHIPANLLRAIRAMIQADFDEHGDTVAEKRTLSDKLMLAYKQGYAG